MHSVPEAFVHAVIEERLRVAERERQAAPLMAALRKQRRERVLRRIRTILGLPPEDARK